MTTNTPVPLNELPPAIRAILCPPTIAGEDPAMAAELFALVQQDWDPRSFREWTLVSQVANADLEILRFGPVRKWVFNAAVARAILKQIIDAHVAKEGVSLAQRDAPLEDGYAQSWWRRMKRLSFAAVSGDNDAVQIIESKIGPNKVGLGAERLKSSSAPWRRKFFWIDLLALPCLDVIPRAGNSRVSPCGGRKTLPKRPLRREASRMFHWRRRTRRLYPSPSLRGLARTLLMCGNQIYQRPARIR
jgi:hypothetical protein